MCMCRLLYHRDQLDAQMNSHSGSRLCNGMVYNLQGHQQSHGCHPMTQAHLLHGVQLPICLTAPAWLTPSM